MTCETHLYCLPKRIVKWGQVDLSVWPLMSCRSRSTLWLPHAPWDLLELLLGKQDTVSGLLQIPTTVASWSLPAILNMAVIPCFTQIQDKAYRPPVQIGLSFVKDRWDSIRSIQLLRWSPRINRSIQLLRWSPRINASHFVKESVLDQHLPPGCSLTRLANDTVVVQLLQHSCISIEPYHNLTGTPKTFCADSCESTAKATSQRTSGNHHAFGAMRNTPVISIKKTTTHIWAIVGK